MAMRMPFSEGGRCEGHPSGFLGLPSFHFYINLIFFSFVPNDALKEYSFDKSSELANDAKTIIWRQTQMKKGGGNIPFCDMCE